MPVILMVDDEPLIRRAVSDFLQDSGFDVLEASNAAEAIKTITSNDKAIDLVFSDVRMPGELDGFGLSRWIRQNRPDLPVILTSGYAKKAGAAQALQADEPFIPKPYNVQFVVGKIRATIEAKGKPA